jgi:hypothetical protein
LFFLKPQPRIGRYEHIVRIESSDNIEHPEADEVEFTVPPELLAKPTRRKPEPGLMRSLALAVVVGVMLGLFLWFFKPTPRNAEATPIRPPMKLQNATRTNHPVDLFELPEWDESAAARKK